MAATHESRRVVTVVFADVVGSTALGEALDPESIRRHLQAWFATASAVIERHGGTVEKFVGDAVMAVFGVPTTHEDDALRAVRAAGDLAAAERGPLEIRVGIDTGEVVVGDPASGASFVTGDAVNMAARLQAAADPGQVLMGATTHRLARAAITTEPLAPLALKGKREPVAAYRLIAVDASREAIARRIDTPMVGRNGEMARLREVFERAVADRATAVALVLGPPGIGKSRLVHELVLEARGDGATILRGRCLPYGTGITYWPVVELVHAAAGVTADDTRDAARAKVVALTAGDEHGDLVGRRVGALVGLVDEAAPIEETTWAVRRMLEHLARQAPLVVVLDDLQWAEPGLLELLAHVADLSREVPLLLLLVARPELAESHPDWAARPGAVVVALDTLQSVAAERIVDDLFPGRLLDLAARERITALAEGNPLYLEQYTAMLLDDGWLADEDGRLVATRPLAELPTPETIGALLAARLDRLPDAERRTAERASVVGRTFWWGAVRELSPELERAAVGGSITALVRRDLLLPDRSEFAGDEAYRFRHSSSAMPPTPAYPSASARTSTSALQRGSRPGPPIGSRSTRRSWASTSPRPCATSRRSRPVTRGSPSFGDGRSGTTWSRADEPWTPEMPLPRRCSWAEPTLSSSPTTSCATRWRATSRSRWRSRAARASASTSFAPRRRDCPSPTRPRYGVRSRLWPSRASWPCRCHSRTRPTATGSSSGLEGDANELALAYAWHAISLDRWFRYRIADAEAARGIAIDHARRAGARRLEDLVLYWGARFYGPMPIEDGIADAERELAAAGDRRIRRASILVDLACLRAVQGDVTAARDAVQQAVGHLHELGQRLYAAAAAEFGGMVERFGGEADRGYDLIAKGLDGWRSVEAGGYLVTMTAMAALLAAQARRPAELETALRRV